MINFITEVCALQLADSRCGRVVYSSKPTIASDSVGQSMCNKRRTSIIQHFKLHAQEITWETASVCQRVDCSGGASHPATLSQGLAATNTALQEFQDKCNANK